MLGRVSKLGVSAVTSRLAVPWNTQTQWSYLGFICGLVRTASAGDDVIVSEYWFKRMKGTTPGIVKTTGSISTFVANAGEGGAVARAMLVWRVAMSSSRRGPALGSSRSPESGKSRRVRQVDWRVLSAHRWVRQRPSHNRRTPQVMDHGLLSEHQRCCMHCRFRRGACDEHAEEECGDSRTWCEYLFGEDS